MQMERILMSSKMPILTRFYKHLWKLFLEDGEEDDKEILLDLDLDDEESDENNKKANES